MILVIFHLVVIFSITSAFFFIYKSLSYSFSLFFSFFSESAHSSNVQQASCKYFSCVKYKNIYKIPDMVRRRRRRGTSFFTSRFFVYFLRIRSVDAAQRLFFAYAINCCHYCLNCSVHCIKIIIRTLQLNVLYYYFSNQATQKTKIWSTLQN